MRILSWNIQWGRGADGRVNFERLIADLRRQDADVLCLQEVACSFPDLPGGACEDGVALLAAAFPEYHLEYAPGVEVWDAKGRRAAFGNLILTRLPPLAVFRHLLPFPADPGVPGMPRSCLEIVLSRPSATPGEAKPGEEAYFRVLTTHLEYYSPLQRLAQAQALRSLQAEVVAHNAARARGQTSAREADGPFRPRPRPEAALLCGDFNCQPASPAHAALTEVATEGKPVWVDAWLRLHPQRAHAPSVGLHGADWPDQAFCCDYFFVSPALAGRLRGLHVDAETAASDHQPLILELD